MPSLIKCRECRLQFSLGWYHYHIFDSGYGSQTLMACTACGCQHSIEHAFDRTGMNRVSLIFVPEQARVDVLRLFRERFECSYEHAKEMIEQLPVCLSEDASPREVEWLSLFAFSRGIKLEISIAAIDRLLSASVPCVDEQQPELVVVKTEMPLKSNGEIDFKRLPCESCSAVGTLSNRIDDFSTCPHCNQQTLETVSQWIT